MAGETYKIESAQNNAHEQIDTTLALIRDKCHDGSHKWSAEILKGDNGLALFQIQFTTTAVPEAKPKKAKPETP